MTFSQHNSPNPLTIWSTHCCKQYFGFRQYGEEYNNIVQHIGHFGNIVYYNFTVVTQYGDNCKYYDNIIEYLRHMQYNIIVIYGTNIVKIEKEKLFFHTSNGWMYRMLWKSTLNEPIIKGSLTPTVLPGKIQSYFNHRGLKNIMLWKSNNLQFFIHVKTNYTIIWKSIPGKL